MDHLYQTSSANRRPKQHKLGVFNKEPGFRETNKEWGSTGSQEATPTLGLLHGEGCLGNLEAKPQWLNWEGAAGINSDFIHIPAIDFLLISLSGGAQPEAFWGPGQVIEGKVIIWREEWGLFRVPIILNTVYTKNLRPHPFKNVGGAGVELHLNSCSQQVVLYYYNPGIPAWQMNGNEIFDTIFMGLTFLPLDCGQALTVLISRILWKWQFSGLTWGDGQLPFLSLGHWLEPRAAM